MAQKDWIEVLQIIANKKQDYLSDFLASDEIFLPNVSQTNPFHEISKNFILRTYFIIPLEKFSL